MIMAKWVKVCRASRQHLTTHALHNTHQPFPSLPIRQHRVSPLSTIPEEITPPPVPVKPHSAIPAKISLPRDTLLQSIGFRRPDDLLKHFHTIAQPTVSIQRDSSPEIKEGSVGTMKAAKRNTTPTQLPLSYNHLWHIDIGFGPTVGLGGIKYSLMCIDKATQIRKVYGLKNLKSSLYQAMQQFIINCGEPPKHLRTDFDSKLFGGKIRQLLRTNNIDIKSSPPH